MALLALATAYCESVIASIIQCLARAPRPQANATFASREWLENSSFRIIDSCSFGTAEHRHFGKSRVLSRFFPRRARGSIPCPTEVLDLQSGSRGKSAFIDCGLRAVTTFSQFHVVLLRGPKGLLTRQTWSVQFSHGLARNANYAFKFKRKLKRNWLADIPASSLALLSIHIEKACSRIECLASSSQISLVEHVVKGPNACADWAALFKGREVTLALPCPAVVSRPS
ncbi:unnamed protein product [Durusdinium trenchii]|uniref:Secreted protein n=1 Tax=Durusdinium trenchii TaxID=1381693 RepID=A0ABP0LR44_9DINO